MSRKEREAELHENDFLLCNGTETKQPTSNEVCS
jgi:hypothetical protein